jgi:hypothetical protein
VLPVCHPGIFSSSIRKYLKIIELMFPQTHCAQVYQKKRVKLQKKGLSCQSRLMLAVMPINICNAKNG